MVCELSGGGAVIEGRGWVFDPYGSTKIKFESRPPADNEADLFAQHRHLAESMAHRLHRRFPKRSYDEHLSNCYFSMLKTLRTLRFDPQRGADISAYLRAAMERQGRQTKFDPLHNSLTVGVTADTVCLNLRVEQGNEQPGDRLEAREMDTRLKLALGQLAPREREVVSAMFWKERTGCQLATELNCSAANVSMIRKKALDKLRAILSAYVLYG